jgi:mRNA interferase MazF
VVVLSANELLVGVDHELIVIVPLSSSLPHSALRPQLGSETGIDNPSVAICRGVRGVARSRLLRPIGAAPDGKMGEIEQALKLTLALP